MKLQVKKKLIDDLKMKFGTSADPSVIIEYLYEAGTIDDCIARKHLVKATYFERMLQSSTGITQIQQDISEEMYIDRTWVSKLVTSSHG